MTRRITLFISLLAFCFSATQCRAQSKARYISIAPSTTEILFALGLGDEIVAVSAQCNYPAAALQKEKIGTFSDPNIEKIVSLKPSMVFTTGLEQAPAVNRLRQLGIPVCESDPVTIERLFASIQDIGGKTGRAAQARAIIQAIQRRLARITEKIRSVPSASRKKVFVEIWQDPLLTAGKGSLVDDIITAAGGVNIAGAMLRPYSYFSGEQVIARDPDYIFLGHRQGTRAATETVYTRAGWQAVSAVKNKRVYDVDPDILLRPGPRMIEAVETMYKKMYEP